MENYEKKYKEAFEKAKQMFSEKELNYIFPELAESEDEKIRKSLLEYLHTLPNHYSHNGVCAPEWITWIEKQGEQKHVDGVEPKFKVGDWVVWDNKISCHIDNIYQGKESLMYTITDANNMTRSFSVKGFDSNVHLWTIQDAKDGDILVVERDKSPFIFKGFDRFHPECPVAYCGIDDNGIFIVNSGDGWWTDENVEPATKEQRDLLFKKMKESGYEWDAEKNESRKIEHNSKFNADIKYEIMEFIRSRGGFKQEYLNYIENTCDKNNLIKDICKK